jgi:type III pantothenate kinase
LPAFWQRYLDALAVPVLRFPAEVEPPVRTQYQRPEQLGADRLAACCGAIRLYPGRAALVLDAGSCLTYDWVDAQGWHGGGGISPGLRMRLQAMHQFTAALPEVEPGGFPPPLVPTNTREALLAGAWRGMAHEIEALIGRFRQRFGSFKTLLTGGDAPHLTPLLESRIFVHPNLNLHGLYQSLPAHDS